MRIELFISYASANLPLVEQIAEFLRARGMFVYWDKELALEGKQFAPIIDRAINEAQCVLVLWTSERTAWVEAEALRAMKTDKFVQFREESEELTVPFNNVQCGTFELIDNALPPESLEEIARAVKGKIGTLGPKEHAVNARFKPFRSHDLAIEGPTPGMQAFSSFRPCDEDGVFLLYRAETTDGWVPESLEGATQRHFRFSEDPEAQYEETGGQKFLKVANNINFIKDPLRPYSIQIGDVRSQRPFAAPGEVQDLALTPDEVALMQIRTPQISMLLAEVLSNEESLNFLYDEVRHFGKWDEATKASVLRLIGKNPDAPEHIQKQHCLFCGSEFRERRHLSSESQEETHGAYLIANDYPFGPFFHFVAITDAMVHAWEDATFPQVKGLNLLVLEFLKTLKDSETSLNGAAGVQFGFNSTVRHLVLGARSHSSAGASIRHVHKQVWGVPKVASNLAEQLIQMSDVYWTQGVDYQDHYRLALAEGGYVIWSDEHVTLYVPYGQCSMYEMQAMINQPCGNLLDLTEEQMISLSKAEHIAHKLFAELRVNSFNHVLLSKFLGDNRAPRFHLVEAFVTREIEFAVSELSGLFVVDQHPWTSRNDITAKWEKIRGAVLVDIGEGKQS